MKLCKSILLLFVLFLFLATQGLAEENSAGGKEEEGPKEAHHGKSAAEVAKDLANPNSSLASLTCKSQKPSVQFALSAASS